MAWKKMQLGDFLINREGKYKPNDVEIANLKRVDKINFSGNIFLSNKGSNTDMILIKKGDLVISGINVEKGAIAVYEGENDVVATIHYSSYIFNTKKIDIEFLKLFLRSPDFIMLLKEQVPGGIKTEIKPKHMLPLEVFFPDNLEEQKKIANHFFERERKFICLSQNLSNQLNQIENLNQAILQEAVQGKLVKQDAADEPATKLLKRIKAAKAASGKKEKPISPIKSEEIPFQIPESWVWCRLGQVVAHIFDGPFGSHLKTKDYTNTGVQVIRLQNLGVMRFKDEKETFISPTKYETIKQHTVYEGDLIIGSFLADGVNCTVLPKLRYTTIAKADCFTIRISNDLLSAHFFMYLLSSKLMFKELSKLLRGMTRLRINTTQLKQLATPLPPLPEQKRIVAEIEKQLAKTKQLKEHIIANQQATEQLLKALLHQAFEVEERATAVTKKEIGKLIPLTADEVSYDNLVAEPVINYGKLADSANSIRDKDVELAMIIEMIHSRLGIHYGEVALQKTVFNAAVIRPIFSKPYQFIKSNFGTYCYELKEDLKNNQYLVKKKIGDKEVFAVHPGYRKNVLDAITSSTNKDFNSTIAKLTDIYCLPFINRKTDKIELLNTVLKLMIDHRTTVKSIIYDEMKKWQIEQAGYTSKADKFTSMETERMIKLIISQGLVKQV